MNTKKAKPTMDAQLSALKGVIDSHASMIRLNTSEYEKKNRTLNAKLTVAKRAIALKDAELIAACYELAGGNDDCPF